jgi:predicted N-acyltransferase
VTGVPTGLSTRVVRTVDELVPASQRLTEATGAPFFYGREFLTAYEHHPVQRVHDVFYVEVTAPDGELVAFVPCYVQGDPLGALGLVDGEVALLTHTWHCFDTRLVATDRSPAVVDGILDVLRREARRAGIARFGFINAEAGTPTAAALETAGLPGTHLDVRYCLDLTRFGAEADYLAMLRPNARLEYRRHLRRAEEAGVEVVERHAGADEDPERMRLFEVSMARLGSPGYYSAERIAAFLGEMRTQARVVEVTLDGDLVALGVLFVDGTKVYTWAAGYNRERRLPFSPYYVLHAASVRLALRLGVPVLEGGRRNGQFKERYAMAPKTLCAHMADA